MSNTIRIGGNSFRAVIFDMDGVLVDSEPHHIEVEKTMFRELGLSISETEHQTYMGKATDLMWAEIIEHHGLEKSPGYLQKYANRMAKDYFQNLAGLEPIPGITLLLEKLSAKKIPLAVASSSLPDVIDIILQKSGLRNHFRFVVNSRMAGRSKPAPDIFLLTSQKLEIDPDMCPVIEDSTNGVIAAKAAGMYCVAYRGENAQTQDHSRADMIIHDFEELIQSIE